MTKKEIAQQRIQNQQIYRPGFKKPEEVVRWMGAVQAQHYLASLWAIGLRTPTSTGMTEEDIEKAVAEKKIVRTWPMRGTLHFVAAEDIHWMLNLLAPRVIRSSAGRYRDLDLDENTFRKSAEILENKLQGGKQLINSELYEALEQENISTEGQRGYHILCNLAQKGVLCFGNRRGKQQSFTLLAEWIPASTAMDREEALAELARRYITSHGPATDYDFAAWSGLTLKDVRRGLELNQKDLSQKDLEGYTYWFKEPEVQSEKVSKEVFLLPAFDEMLCGYKDRSAILGSDDQKSIILRNGIFKPVVIADNKVAGSWKRTLQKKKVEISFEIFTTEQNGIERADKAAKNYGRFLGLPVELKSV